MRGRIALLKHSVQNPLKILAISSCIRGTFGVRARARVALGMCLKRIFKMPVDVRISL
jgi:hypothetical protein